MPSESDIRAGGAFVELGAADLGLDKALNQLSARLSKIGTDFLALGTRVLAGAGILSAPLILAIREAGDFTESISKFREVFKDQSDAVEAWADSFRNSVGRSKKDIVDFLAKAGDVSMALGFSPEDATQMAKTMTMLAVDLASFHNIASDQEAFRALQSGILGSTEVLRERFGVSINEATLKLRALENGLNPKKLTEAQKVWLRLNEVINSQARAVGDAKRTADSFNNQIKRLQATLSDTAREIGQVLIPVVTPLVQKFGAFVSVIGEYLTAHPELITAFAQVVGLLFAIGAGLIAAGVAAKIFAFLLSPAGIGTVAVAGLLAILDVLGFVQTGFGELFNSIRIAGTGLSTWWGALVIELASMWEKLVSGFLVLGGDLVTGLLNIPKAVMEAFLFMADTVTDSLNVLIRAANKLGAGFSELEKPSETIGNVFDDIQNRVIDGTQEIEDNSKRVLEALEKEKQALFKKDPQQGNALFGVDFNKLKEAALKIPGKIFEGLGITADALGLGPLLDDFSTKINERLGEFQAKAQSFQDKPELPGIPGAGGRSDFSGLTAGTFTTGVASALVGTGPMEKSLEVQKNMKTILERIEDNTRNAATGRFG